MRGPARVVAIGSIMLTLSCSHWYTRGTMAVAGGAAWGAGLGALLPCLGNSSSNCQPGQSEELAIIGVAGALAFWGLGELIFSTGGGSSSEDYEPTPYYGSSGGGGGGGGYDPPVEDPPVVSPTPDVSPSGGGGTPVSSGAVGVTSASSSQSYECRRGESFGGSSDTSKEPELNASGTDQRIEYGGTGQGLTYVDACAAAKNNAFDNLSAHCPSSGGQTTYLDQWIINRQTCTCNYCGGGGLAAFCSVHGEGVCQVGASMVATYGTGDGSDDESATGSAFVQARARCVGAEDHRETFGCQTYNYDGAVHHVCQVAVYCHRD
jgi:hypothetical protein